MQFKSYFKSTIRPYFIIKSKEAANITNPGEFILQVDNNSIKADALYSKRNYSANKEINVSLLDDEYNIKASKSIKNKSNVSEAMYYSSLINNIVDKLDIKVQKIDFEKPKKSLKP